MLMQLKKNMFFLFIDLFIIVSFIGVAYILYTGFSDPASLGRFVGEVVSGFNEKVK